LVSQQAYEKDLAIRALDMVVALRKPPKRCIHHSDRGSQNCSHEYQARLRKHGFKVSMSGKGNCYNNAAMETFFKTITLNHCYAIACRAAQSRTYLAVYIAHASSSRACYLSLSWFANKPLPCSGIYQWLLQSTP